MWLVAFVSDWLRRSRSGYEGRFLLHSSLQLVLQVFVRKRWNMQSSASCLGPPVSCRLKTSTLCRPSWAAWCVSPFVRSISFSSAVKVRCQVTTLGWPWRISPRQCDLWDSVLVCTRRLGHPAQLFVWDLRRSEDAAYCREESIPESINLFMLSVGSGHQIWSRVDPSTVS